MQVNQLVQEYLAQLQRIKSKKIYENNFSRSGGTLMAAKIKKGDNVIVLSGKDKGKNGKSVKDYKVKN